LCLNSDAEGKKLFSATLEEVHHALQREAQNKNWPVRDLACTLLLFVATPDWLVAMQIGDGFIVVKPAGDTYQLLFSPDKGEYANETSFVTSKDVLKQMRCCFKRGGYSFICASTDGLERLAIDFRTWTPSPGFFQPFEDYLKEPKHLHQDPDYLKTFLESDRLNARTDDDKTLLVCLRDDTGALPIRQEERPISDQLTVLSPQQVLAISSSVSQMPEASSSRLHLYLLLQTFAWSAIAGLWSSYFTETEAATPLTPTLILGLSLLLAWGLSHSRWRLRLIVLTLPAIFPILIEYIKPETDFFSLITPISMAFATGIIASLTILNSCWPKKSSPLLLTALIISIGFYLGWLFHFLIP
jgi:hypothetical protein